MRSPPTTGDSAQFMSECGTKSVNCGQMRPVTRWRSKGQARARSAFRLKRRPATRRSRLARRPFRQRAEPAGNGGNVGDDQGALRSQITPAKLTRSIERGTASDQVTPGISSHRSRPASANNCPPRSSAISPRPDFLEQGGPAELKPGDLRARESLRQQFTGDGLQPRLIGARAPVQFLQALAPPCELDRAERRLVERTTTSAIASSIANKASNAGLSSTGQ